MNKYVLATLGISSAVFNLVALVPYIRDVLKHKTKPERATWWIFLALAIIAFFAQLAAGATWSLFMTGASVVVLAFIAIISIRFGYGTFKKKDLVALIIAMGGLLFWKYTKDPLSALAIVIAVDFLGFWLTVTKTWAAPQTETLITWMFTGLSGALGVIAVGKIDFTRLVYPLYVTLGDWFLVWVILYRRRPAKS